MNLMKIFCCRSVLFYFFAQTQIGLSSPLSCAPLVRRASYAKLVQAAAVSVERGTVEAPFWFTRALPEGVRFVATPGREHAPGRIQKELGPDFVVAQVDFVFNNTPYTTTVGLSPFALADNLTRAERGQPLTFLPEGARAAGLWVHGGGTESSNHANAGNSAVQFSKRNISIVGLDWPGHGTNRPSAYSPRPMDYVELSLWFMRNYFGNEGPLFQIGHSMGGQVGDLIQTLMTPADIDAKFPGLKFKGIVMLSPPLDKQSGANLHEKVISDNEYTDRKAQEALFDKDNINLASQEPLTDQFFLTNWNAAMLERQMVPGFAGMGVLDDVCYMGCETAWKTYMEGRPNTSTALYDNVVDHNGTTIRPDHMIPKYYLPGQSQRDGVGNTIPIAFADALRFIEREVIGNKDFDPFAKEGAENLASNAGGREDDQVKALRKEKSISEAQAREEVQTKNAQRAYRGGLAKVLGLFAKNTLFREFVKTFYLKKRVPISGDLSRDLNVFLNGIDRFALEVAKYDRHLSNSRVPVEDIQGWHDFFEWMRAPTPENKSKAESLARRWGQLTENKNAGHRYAAGLLAETLGANFDGYRIKDVPQEFPIHLKMVKEAVSSFPREWTVFNDWMNHPSEALRNEAQALSREWSTSNVPDRFLAAKALAMTLGDDFASIATAPVPKEIAKNHALFASGAAPLTPKGIADFLYLKSGVSDISAKIETQKQIVLGYRDLDLDALSKAYPELKALAEEKARIFAEHRELINKRNLELLPTLVTLHAQRMQLQRLFSKDAFAQLLHKGTELDELSHKLPSEGELLSATHPAAIRPLIETLIQDGWKHQAFESFLGPDLRTFFSTLDQINSELSSTTKPERIKLLEQKLASTWSEGISAFTSFTNKIRGAKSFDQARSEPLDHLQNDVETIRNQALDILEEFFKVRENFIAENHQHWSSENRPAYPARYYDLISQYKDKQAEYQHARHRYDIEQRELAREGVFGPYMQFIYSKLEELETNISRLNGDNSDIGHRRSLTSVEDRAQEIEDRLHQIDEHVIRTYAPALYRNETTSAWDIFDNPDEKPTMDQINQILDAWNRIWRDPTGGQVQDASAY